MEKTIYFNGKWYNEKSLKSLLRKGVIDNLKKNNEYQSYAKQNQQSWNNTTNEMITNSLINNTVNEVYDKIMESSIKTSNN